MDNNHIHMRSQLPPYRGQPQYPPQPPHPQYPSHPQYPPHTQYPPHQHLAAAAPYLSLPPENQSRLSDTITRDGNGNLVNPAVSLIIRQQPKEALVFSAGKEKTRKPVDPPPIVQLKVDESAEASQHFLQSPYLFMTVSLWKADQDERWDHCGSQNGPSHLYGGLCSSLHRLKDIDNKDGGFFIFGDISVNTTGTFRLQFKLYDMQKDVAVFIGSIKSDPFNVVSAKGYLGLEPSTYLSRTFSDQGVRLRLRKESRVKGRYTSPAPQPFQGTKRSYPHNASPPTIKRPYDEISLYENASLPRTKRPHHGDPSLDGGNGQYWSSSYNDAGFPGYDYAADGFGQPPP